MFQTLRNLLLGDIEQFLAGLFISGLMLWWSKAVRDRRLKKKFPAGKPSKNKPEKKINTSHSLSNADDDTQSEQVESTQDVVPKLERELDSTRRELERAKLELEKAKSEVSRLWAETKSQIFRDTQSMKDQPNHDSRPSKDVDTKASDPIPAMVETQAAPIETVVQNRKAESLSEEEFKEVDSGPARPDWKDSQGKELRVGAKVTFLANSRGQSVSIPGTLLGDRNGQALIEVSSGALLPRNDYAIPWNVLTLSD